MSEIAAQLGVVITLLNKWIIADMQFLHNWFEITTPLGHSSGRKACVQGRTRGLEALTGTLPDCIRVLLFVQNLILYPVQFLGSSRLTNLVD